MIRPTLPDGRPAPGRLAPEGGLFAGATLAVGVLAALLAGWAPVGFSIMTVFLFAGPHNWMEARYLLARLPARWGKLRRFFLLSPGGALALAAAFVTLAGLAYSGDWDPDELARASAVWTSMLLVWVAALVRLRSRQQPRRAWGWVPPAVLALAAVT
jgi:hypothetical protein